ncbi:hypothetical protein TN53_43335, partial [Streptomyces sp. WM6386]
HYFEATDQWLVPHHPDVSALLRERRPRPADHPRFPHEGFYEALGWRGQDVQETVFFQAGGVRLGSWGRGTLPAGGAAPAKSSCVNRC